MDFERGLDPKSALDIGIRKKIKEVSQKIVEENIFNLANTSIRQDMEKRFEKEVGFPVDIFFDLDHREVMFNIKMPIQKIQIEFKIGPNEL